ncbi:hypothetical protein RF11_00294 [Thelohanellus kitauei]|uniref:Uncharacterized protein n=1 Tax=Thelohanellus kitauei TaxID=669202 RepID=A0A0C2MTW8_THEKT|nr:hypothetical protein RF11_00294 [Thelohanellus kitauei]
MKEILEKYLLDGVFKTCLWWFGIIWFKVKLSGNKMTSSNSLNDQVLGLKFTKGLIAESPMFIAYIDTLFIIVHEMKYANDIEILRFIPEFGLLVLISRHHPERHYF